MIALGVPDLNSAPKIGVKRRTRAQMVFEVVHSYSVVAANGGSPSREQVGEEVVRVVEIGGP
jgi:hypothetical protein